MDERIAANAFEDFKCGQRFTSASYVVTEANLRAFAGEFDPQQFHLDRDFAERSLFKGLAASGWHTAAVTMRLFVQTLNFEQGAIGLGVDELRWPLPVRAGDSLAVQTEILEARTSQSQGRYGILKFKNTTTNQRGEIVQTFIASALVMRRTQSREPGS